MRPDGPIVTIGEVLSVFLARDGEPLTAASSFDRTFAGAESNVAVALARLGVPAVLLGRVGNDPLGVVARRHLRGEGVDVHHVSVDPLAGTGMMVRSASSAGVEGVRGGTEVVYARSGSAGSRLTPDDISAELIASASALHLTGITPLLSLTARAAAHRAAELATAASVPISFDPNVRYRLGSVQQIVSTLREFVPYADVILPSVEEALLLSGATSTAQAEQWFFDRGPRLVVVKDGARGAWAVDHTTRWAAPPHTVVAVDPVGAGDAFDAGFLSLYRRGGTVARALERGALLGAVAVTFRGDTVGLPELERLEAEQGRTASGPQEVLR